MKPCQGCGRDLGDGEPCPVCEAGELEPIRCWCGAEGTFNDLFDTSGLDSTCGGTGSLNCYCGGDQCVCHFHGETDCPGCEDCLDPDDYYDEDDYYEDLP
jgi:hypothetical protein